MVIDSNKNLLFDRNLTVPPISSCHNGQSEIWVANFQSGNRVIPKGIYVGLTEPVDEGHLRVISDTSYGSNSKQVSNPVKNCSLMMSPELRNEKKNLAELLRTFFGIFTKTDKTTAAQTNVKHRIHTGIMLKSTNEPT